MVRATKPKIVTAIGVAREGGTYHLRIEDAVGKVAHYQTTADQALRLDELADGSDRPSTEVRSD